MFVGLPDGGHGRGVGGSGAGGLCAAQPGQVPGPGVPLCRRQRRPRRPLLRCVPTSAPFGVHRPGCRRVGLQSATPVEQHTDFWATSVSRCRLCRRVPASLAMLLAACRESCGTGGCGQHSHGRAAGDAVSASAAAVHPVLARGGQLPPQPQPAQVSLAESLLQGEQEAQCRPLVTARTSPCSRASWLW